MTQRDSKESWQQIDMELTRGELIEGIEVFCKKNDCAVVAHLA